MKSQRTKAAYGNKCNQGHESAGFVFLKIHSFYFYCNVILLAELVILGLFVCHLFVVLILIIHIHQDAFLAVGQTVQLTKRCYQKNDS